MKLTLPIYVQKQSPEAGAAHVIRPLFFKAPEARDVDLHRAVNKLAKALRQHCIDLGNRMRHDELAEFSFLPTTEDHRFKFLLDLPDRKAPCTFLIVAFQAMGRKIAFTPSLPELWFEVERGETLRDRAEEVLTAYFRDRFKRAGKNAVRPEQLSVEGKAWVTTLTISVQPPAVATTPKQSFWAALTEQKQLDGAQELETVGRCLDWLYPDDLDRVIGRDEEVGKITKWLARDDRRPVLLIGPRLGGKTAIIHEVVYQAARRRKSAYSAKRNTWLIAPQRLISGMSYVGQWENRLLAIIEEAGEKKHVLYFDDLLGLFQAGRSASADLSVADVLKPYVEKRAVRLMAEITPEAFRVFQEKDRGFADLFHLIPVKETDEDTTLRILISLMRQLERAHRCRFATEALPTIINITRRYVRDAVFPGKAATFLRGLAVKFRAEAVTRASVLDEFHAKSGLALAFLNDRVQLDRREVAEALGKDVIGQPAAIDACADVVSVAKARLNDMSRPLASFLFLGPTGVGKTQCAKSLAAYLFGDADKLLRFDMNEYASPAAVARLVGTFDQPEGLLTSAVRRQPFAVVLLDEIEKAHPDVFNLLLQVMGDGRLTDALGRPADFTNAILILTSNLGVREAASQLGFHQDASKQAHVYVQAAEKFFKPEFFNRLDRVVPFERLRREEIGEIARGLIRGVFEREGLLRRRSILQVDDRAMARIVDSGFHPQLGARALKRMIEKKLTQTIAARLAALSADVPTIISVYPSRDDLAVVVEGLRGAAPVTAVQDTALLVEPRQITASVESAIRRIEDEAARLRPRGPITTDAVEPEHVAYFLIKEQARRLWDSLRRVEARMASAANKRMAGQSKGRSLAAAQQTLRQTDHRDWWRELIAARDPHAYLRELATATPPHGERLTDYLAELIREAALLDVMASRTAGSPDRALISIHSPDPARKEERAMLQRLYHQLFDRQLSYQVSEPVGLTEKDALALVIAGPGAFELARREAGTHLMAIVQESLAPLQVRVLPLDEGEEAKAAMSARARAREAWLDGQARGEANGADPFALLPVIRVYGAAGAALDLRTGLMTLKTPTVFEMRALLLAMLTLPPEVSVLEG